MPVWARLSREKRGSQQNVRPTPSKPTELTRYSLVFDPREGVAVYVNLPELSREFEVSLDADNSVEYSEVRFSACIPVYLHVANHPVHLGYVTECYGDSLVAVLLVRPRWMVLGVFRSKNRIDCECYGRRDLLDPEDVAVFFQIEFFQAWKLSVINDAA